MKNSMVRLEMMKKKMRALTWCVGMRALSHCMPAREAQSMRCSLISSRACRGNLSSWKEARDTHVSHPSKTGPSVDRVRPERPSEDAADLLLKRQLVGILHHHVVVVILVIVSSCGHDGRGRDALGVLLGHLHKVVEADVGAGCRDTQDGEKKVEKTHTQRQMVK